MSVYGGVGIPLMCGGGVFDVRWRCLVGVTAAAASFDLVGVPLPDDSFGSFEYFERQSILI